MKKLQCLVITILFVFLTPLSVFATPVFTLESSSSTTGTNINDLTSFERTGDFSEIFRNNTGKRFTDFHIVFANYGTDSKNDGGTLFKDVQSSRAGGSSNVQEINFFLGSNGTGISPGEYFKIIAVGFDNIGSSGTKTIVRMHPTIPEPTSLALLGLGLAGFSASRKKN